MNDQEKIYRARCIVAQVGRGLSERNAMYALFDLFEVGDESSQYLTSPDVMRTVNEIIDNGLAQERVQNNMNRKGR